MSIAVFSYRNETLPVNGMLSGREQLFQMLKELSVQPFVTLEAEAAYTDAGVEVAMLVSEDKIAPTGLACLEDIDLIVNRKGKSFDYTKMPAGTKEAMPPVINRNEMRSLAFRKHRVQDEVFGPLGMGMPTQLVSDGDMLADFANTYQALEYVVKPDGGSGGEGIMRVARQSVRAAMLLDPKKPHVIQPAYDLTAPFPSYLKPYDAKSREAFEGWSQSAVPKELRVYGFHSPQATEVFPIGRAIKDGSDHWFFIDPDSIPDSVDVVEKSRLAIRRAAKISGSQAVFGTVDSGYGRLSPENSLTFHALELNGKEPYLLGYDKHPDIADHLRQLLANQIAQTIEAQKP